MRNAFADEITKLAKNDDRIILLSGDIGNRLFDNLKAIALHNFIIVVLQKQTWLVWLQEWLFVTYCQLSTPLLLLQQPDVSNKYGLDDPASKFSRVDCRYWLWLKLHEPEFLYSLKILVSSRLFQIYKF